MDLFTHLIFGALIYSFFFGDYTLEFFFLAVFFSILPDLDIFIMPLKRVFKSNYFEHRSGSHSYIIGVIISMVSVIMLSFRLT